jgi:hypothetical protein
VEAEVKKVLVVLLLCGAIYGQKKVDRRSYLGEGIWSSHSISLMNTASGLDENPGRLATIYSPDRKKKLIVKGEEVSVWIGDKSYKTEFGRWVSPEIGWAPDSSKFYLVWSHAGLQGTWHTDIYRVDGAFEKLASIDSKIRDDFDSALHKRGLPSWVKTEADRGAFESAEFCETNVAASQWLDAETLLLRAFAPGTGRCKYWSEFKVYRVNVRTGEILQTLPWNRRPAKTTKRDFITVG